MSSRQFIPIEPEERIAVLPCLEKQSSVHSDYSRSQTQETKKNFYTNELARERKTRSKSLFQKAVACLRGLFNRTDDNYSLEEMDQMIAHFKRAISYLQEEKIDQMKKRS